MFIPANNRSIPTNIFSVNIYVKLVFVMTHVYNKVPLENMKTLSKLDYKVLKSLNEQKKLTKMLKNEQTIDPPSRRKAVDIEGW